VKKLNNAFHLVDKKGAALYNPEPIARWQKRRETVEKKIRKKTTDNFKAMTLNESDVPFICHFIFFYKKIIN
jgi:hypothetical protein